MAGSIETLRQDYLQGKTDPQAELEKALSRAGSNANHNVYIAQDAAWSRKEVARLKPEEQGIKPLWGIPISLKDCFDLEGFATSSGSRYYLERSGLAAKDSAVAARLRAAGAIVTGKTHMHQLAYGITGESQDFGDCRQPSNAAWLTGGSSSGAAASVQERSALAAIGTDTGGSIRVPAALCGLVGFRASITRQGNVWQGGSHLAQSFDTVGWLYRDLADGPLLARVLYDLPELTPPAIASLRIGVPSAAFLHDCEPDVYATLEQGKSLFAQVEEFEAGFWEEAPPIYTPIVAHEAAALHRGLFHHFEPAIAERMAWGESLSSAIMAQHYRRLADFRERMGMLFQRFDYLLLPCAPMASLMAGEDQTLNRPRILRYTSPISLAGLPAVTLPGKAGGLQLVGPLGGDAELLALSASLSALQSS